MNAKTDKTETQSEAKAGARRPAAAPEGLEALESAAAIGRDALGQAVRMTADTAEHAFRGAVAAGAAQLEMAKALREKTPFAEHEDAAALSASSDAARAGFEAYAEKVIGYARAEADANLETVDRLLAAKTPQEWLGVHFEAATRMIDRGVEQAAELARVATDASARSLEPFKERFEGGAKAAA